MFGVTRQVDDNFAANITERNTWFRLFYMILFAMFFNIAEIVILAVVVVQFLSKLLLGEVNERLRSFGRGLGAYAQETIAFLTYHCEDMPFPFAPWPTETREDKEQARPRRRRKPKAKS